MYYQRVLLRILTALLCLTILIVAGCSSTGQATYDDETEFDDVADIDQLLGLADDKAETQENIAEDDVLRLLGVSEASEIDVSQDIEPPAGQTQITTNESAAEEQSSDMAQTQVAVQEPVTQQKEPPPSRRETQQGWGTGTFEEQYQAALSTYRNRQYKSAIQKFEALLSQNMTHSLSDNCQYWIGECYYGLGNYQQAIIAFEKVFTFAKSNKDDASQLKLGLCYMRLNNQAKAKEEFNKLIGNYPSSEYVSIARRFIQKLDQ